MLSTVDGDDGRRRMAGDGEWPMRRMAETADGSGSDSFFLLRIMRNNVLFARPFVAGERRSDQVASMTNEAERLSNDRFAIQRPDAVGGQEQRAEEAGVQGPVVFEPQPGSPVAHRDADVAAQVVFGVARDVGAMSATILHGFVPFQGLRGPCLLSVGNKSKRRA